MPRSQPWAYKEPGHCDLCDHAIMFHDPVLPGPGGKAAHEWCVVPGPSYARIVQKPAYDEGGMIRWCGNVYDPGPALAIEPGCTSEDLLDLAPSVLNNKPLLVRER